jgi:hypothetical protein
MAYCKKLMLYDNRNTGENMIAFLESKYNYFDRKNDWFLVWVISDGRTARRIERKIPDEVALRLKGL